MRVKGYRVLRVIKEACKGEGQSAPPTQYATGRFLVLTGECCKCLVYPTTRLPHQENPLPQQGLLRLPAPEEVSLFCSTKPFL